MHLDVLLCCGVPAHSVSASNCNMTANGGDERMAKNNFEEAISMNFDIKVIGLKPEWDFSFIQCTGLLSLQWKDLGEEFLNTSVWDVFNSTTVQTMSLCGDHSTYKTLVHYPLAIIEEVMQLIRAGPFTVLAYEWYSVKVLQWFLLGIYHCIQFLSFGVVFFFN